MKILAFCNQKGGVGKSTSCFNVGAALKKLGYRVLLIDADPQGDLSTMAGFMELEENDLQLYDVLHGEDVKAAIKEGTELDIIPSDDFLSAGEIDLVEQQRTALKDALKPIRKKYDYCLIDCPPSLGVLTLNALAAADAVIIPVQADYLPLKGVARLRETIEKVRRTFNRGLRIGGIVLTFYSGRVNLDNDVKESLERAFGDLVFNTTIPKNKKLAEAPSYGMSIFKYAPGSKGAACYLALANEIISRE